MDIENKLDLIKQVGEEIITEEDLKKLLQTKSHPIAYDGFEPSGTTIHIAQGLLRAININKMTKAGVKFNMLVADWHAWANNKMGGNLEHIQKVGRYLIEVWRACDMDLDNVKFTWANDFIKDPEYWKILMQVARNNTVKRILRCSEIMGRLESESLQASQIIYPCMQCTDIFWQKCDITQLGMDQRRVNVLAREIGPKLGFWKPVVVSHHMLMGLSEPPRTTNTVKRAIEMKMSKSKPENAIFMNDPEEKIKTKINKAYCPVKVVEENPIMEYCRYIIFEKFKTMEIKRPKKFGGDITLGSYEDLKNVYSQGKLHPMDLKSAVSSYLNELLDPVREKLAKNNTAHKLMQDIKTFNVTG
ncbi:tyrosine--tRNA ligase [Candidatus Woesearchaeota archaeon]|nr:tyrosine--tRNA ligase [Candidatus Woesearchaeota archaeon]MDP6647942.1 tyrosine--tRNA ligase [Candidatus Woesearchaeota archaeon]|tara:strand:+ start:6264 stop:7340 length:1077 start_codon:yes stop_codon:yes gene_type:complete